MPKFEDVAELPVTVRDNPFTPHVKALVIDGPAKAYIVVDDNDEVLYGEDAVKRAEADTRLMASVGNTMEPKITVRTKRENFDDGSIKLYFFAKPKIVKPNATKAAKAAKTAE